LASYLYRLSLVGKPFLLTHSAAGPHPEPFDRVKALSSIEGPGSNVSPAQGQP
jgi:hypothetical protein